MLDRILNYFADVAESVDRNFAPYVGEVVFLDRNLLGELKTIDNQTMQRLKRLTAADRLHAEEHLVWEGRFWILGELDGTEYRWPILRRRVSVGRGFPATNVALVERSAWEPSPGLVDEDGLPAHAKALFEVEAASNFLGTFVEPNADTVVGHYPRLNRLISRYLSAAGLPKLDFVTSRGHIANPGRSDLRLLTASGIYLERHPYELNRSSALKLWALQPIDSSVLAPLYAPSSEPSKPEATGADYVQSPLPLNQSQLAAVISARSNPVTVVAGPPGTGKSHLAAAAAIDRVAAGESVLIAAQSMHACDVVHDLLKRYPMVEALRFGDNLSARRVGDLLAGGVPAPDATYDPKRLMSATTGLVDEIDALRQMLTGRIDEVARFERALRQRHDLPMWMAERDLATIDVNSLRDMAAAVNADGLVKLVARRRARKTIEQALGRPVENVGDLDELLDVIEANQLVDSANRRRAHLDELWDELERDEERWRHAIGDLLEALRRERADIANRTAVHQLASALRMDATDRRAGLAELDRRFLQAVPLWIGTLDEIEAILPVQPALFDLVILDEASQISQLAAVPALARGRHAMIVGDSRQLRHESPVSAEAQTHAAAVCKIPDAIAGRLDDRTNSMFDAATAVAPVITLDEHFRSAAHIIRFSDRVFYDGRLKLMTQHPRNESRDAIGVLTVNGSRDRNGVVRAEVAAVMDRIRTLMAHGVRSIGVVSPVDAQADAIEQEVISSFTIEEIEHHELRIGSVRSFQGSEREHIIISTGVEPGDHAGLGLIEDPAVFNVMVTRAKANVDVITSFDRSTAGDGLLGQYLRHADEPPALRGTHVEASGWTDRIAAEIRDHTEHRVITGYQVAGEYIDLVVGTGHGAFALETEVHAKGPRAHIDRHLALRRAGWEIRSFYRPMFYGNEEEAIARLLAELARSS